MANGYRGYVGLVCVLIMYVVVSYKWDTINLELISNIELFSLLLIQLDRRRYRTREIRAEGMD